MSDMLSDKFSALANATAQDALTRGACEGGSDPKHHFGHATVSKSGVAPAQFSDFATCKANHRFVRIRLVARKLGWPLR